MFTPETDSGGARILAEQDPSKNLSSNPYQPTYIILPILQNIITELCRIQSLRGYLSYLEFN